MQPRALHHLAVLVTDLERAEKFYCDVLELEVLKRHEHEDGSHRSTWLSLGHGAFLALEKAETPQSRESSVGSHPAGWHCVGWHCVALSIDVSERPRWRARLEKAGHPVDRESKFTLYVRDPDGTLVALSHYPVEC